MAGADRRGAGDGPHRAIGIQLDPAVFATTESGDLHVGAEPDAQLSKVTGRAASLLFGPQARIVGGRECAVEGHLVVPGVVDGPGAVGVGEGVGAGKVCPAYLGRVHADLGGEQVDGPFDRRGGLGPARTAVGADRGGVGSHRR